MNALPLLLFVLVLVACGSQKARAAACSNVRGKPSERDASALRERYGFRSCRLISTMNADSALAKESAYQCRR